MIYYANENSSYIQHYGVLGMKWGQHRYKSMIKKSKNLASNGKNREAKKLRTKAEAYKNVTTTMSGGKKTYDYVAKQKMGKTLVKSMIMGSYGSLKYNQLRVKGQGRAKSFAFGAISNLGSVLTAGMLPIYEQSARLQYDNKNKK